MEKFLEDDFIRRCFGAYMLGRGSVIQRGYKGASGTESSACVRCLPRNLYWNESSAKNGILRNPL